MSNSRPFSTGQAAKYCGVSQATVINWIRDGRLGAYTTPGGHHRIPRADLVSFLKTYGMPIDAALERTPRPRLLLVGDGPDLRRLAKALDEKNGVEVSLTSNDYAASARVARLEPDAVVIDMRTSSDPLSLCRWVREFSEQVTLLLVGDPKREASARAAGADEYLYPDALASLEARLLVVLQ
jgi:excisionase family DNA binding protein